MRIKVINPNTTATMTATIAAAARAAAAPGTEIIAVTSPAGPVSIEGHYDEAVSVIGLLQELDAGEKQEIDGHIIACFGDPGLLACREIARGPVLGIAEAAMHMASFISTRFAVVTTLARTRIIAEHLVRSYGMSERCLRVYAIDVPVLELDKPASEARCLVVDQCRKAIDEGAGAIVLGCAGMADLASDLSGELGVPVIDGVGAAVKLVEALVGLGLRTSKQGDLAYPIVKPYTGSLASMAPRAQSKGSTRPGTG
jgi:allantoin racemase